MFNIPYNCGLTMYDDSHRKMMSVLIQMIQDIRNGNLIHSSLNHYRYLNLHFYKCERLDEVQQTIFQRLKWLYLITILYVIMHSQTIIN